MFARNRFLADPLAKCQTEQRRLRGQALWRCRYLPSLQPVPRNYFFRRKERVTGCANRKQVAEMCREKRWLWGPTNNGCFLFLCLSFCPSTSFFSLDVNPGWNCSVYALCSQVVHIGPIGCWQRKLFLKCTNRCSTQQILCCKNKERATKVLSMFCVWVDPIKVQKQFKYQLFCFSFPTTTSLDQN